MEFFRLGQSAIQVSVASVDDNLLPSCMTTLRGRKKKDSHRCDFRGVCHSMPEGNASPNIGEGLFWIVSLTDPEKALSDIRRRIPLGHRMTDAAEIAAMAVFLLSPTQSGHTTGQQIVVDGSYTHLDRALT